MPELTETEPADIARELRRRRVKMETASREYHEYLEATVHANFLTLFRRDRELPQARTEAILRPDGSE